MMRNLAVAMAFWAVFASVADADAAFRMVVKGRLQVSLVRLSYDQTMVHALDEFIAYMNAVMAGRRFPTHTCDLWYNTGSHEDFL